MEAPVKRPRRNVASLSANRLFNTDSPVAKQQSEIQNFLSVCLLSWTDYDDEERQAIISTLPPSYRNTTLDKDGHIECPLSPEFIASDKVLRDQIARFKRDVVDGFYTKTWQERARKAVDDRQNGKFDAYLERHAEEAFGDAEDDEENQADLGRGSDGDYKTTRGKRGQGKSYRKDRRGFPEYASDADDVDNIDG